MGSTVRGNSLIYPARGKSKRKPVLQCNPYQCIPDVFGVPGQPDAFQEDILADFF